MLCGFCCLIRQNWGGRGCIITSAAAPALSSVSGLLSRKITSPAAHWNTGSVLRAGAFLLWLLWTSEWKDQAEQPQGLKSHRSCLVKKGECLDSEREMWWYWATEVFDYILFPSCCRIWFVPLSERSRLSRLPGLQLHFWGILPACWDIVVQYFLPVDLLAGIALLKACASLCGCRAGICQNPEGGCNQTRIRLCCLCISGATFLIKTISLLPLIKPLTGHTAQPHSWGAGWPFPPQFS